MAPRALAWQDGRVLPASEATVPLTDDGFLRGDAVFEGIMVMGGRTHALEAHLARMRRSAKAVGIRLPVLTDAIRDLLVTWGEHDGALKVIVTRGGVLRALVTTPSWPPVMNLAVVDVPWRSGVSGVKTLSYATNMLAGRIAREQEADDALIVNDDLVLELPTGSVAWLRDGRLRTPDPAQLPILDSVTVRELAKVTEVEFGVWGLDDLLLSDEVFVVSATRPVLPVLTVDDATFPAPGPRTEGLRTAFRQHVEATLD